MTVHPIRHRTQGGGPVLSPADTARRRSDLSPFRKKATGGGGDVALREPTDPLAEAQAEVQRARIAVDNCRRRVEEGADIAASLACAQYRLVGAQRRLDTLGGSDDGGPEAA